MENKGTRGKGRVFAHGSSWWIDVTFKGVRRRERVAPLRLGAKGRKLAEAVLAKRSVEISENRFLDIKLDCKTTFYELCDRYLKWAKENHVDYENTDVFFVKNLKVHLGDVLISGISKEDVERYRNKRKGEVGPYTVNHELSTLRLMFNLARERWEHPTNKMQPLFPGDNPAAKFEKLPEKSRERTLSKGELTRMLEHIAEKINQPDLNGRDRKGYRRLLDFVLIAITTGMRLGEIQGLKFGSGDIHVGSTDPIENFIHLRDTKNGEDRKIPLNRISASILEKPFDFEYNPRKLFSKVCEAVKIEGLRIHDLRRSFASFLVNVGADPFSIAGLLGHSLPGFRVTSIYARVQEERKVEMILKLEKYIMEVVPDEFYGTGQAQTVLAPKEENHNNDVSVLNQYT